MMTNDTAAGAPGASAARKRKKLRRYDGFVNIYPGPGTVSAWAVRRGAEALACMRRAPPPTRGMRLIRPFAATGSRAFTSPSPKGTDLPNGRPATRSGRRALNPHPPQVRDEQAQPRIRAPRARLLPDAAKRRAAARSRICALPEIRRFCEPCCGRRRTRPPSGSVRPDLRPRQRHRHAARTRSTSRTSIHRSSPTRPTSGSSCTR